MGVVAINTSSMELSLKKAMEKNEFVLYFQPQLNLETGKIIGTEALIRWKHPDKGLVPPYEFIPFAEESGLILPIGEWVLRTACKQNKEWQEAGFSPMKVSVNLSARQFYQSNLVEVVQQILEETGLEPEFLELEITESMLMDVHNALTILEDLKKLGIQLSLDDFGTGYSSLYYLKELPIDIIKIDQSFVRNCTVDTKDATIVKTIIAMAHQLKLEVIAEGIESKDHLIFLQENLCNTGQGYLFSKPLPVEEFEQQFFEIGEVIQREGIPQETSRQKWLEEELENSRQELRDTVRNQQGMIFKFVEKNGKFIHTLCDGELLYRLGLSSEHIVGKELFDFLPKTDAEQKLTYYRRAWEGEENVTYERYDNGIWYLASLRPVRRGGQVVEVIGSCVNITKRKESEERYQKVVEYSPKGILIHRDGIILYANPTALEIAKEDDLIGKSIFSYVHPDYYDITHQMISQLNQGIECPLTEIKIIRKDGKVIDIEVVSVPIPYDGSPAIMVVYSDITERKQTEQALADSRERYKQLMNFSPEPMVVHQNGMIQYMNDAGVKILGFNDHNEVIGKSFLDFFHPDSRKKAVERIQIIEQGDESHTHFMEYKMIRQDGTIFYIEGTGVSIQYNGKLAIQAIFRDVTTRKEAERAF
ncbi:EAL domain-containing protein [Lysinibacillus sp. NPDC098008]|uniref:EAL domain-containing protein n=1 Tax=Lysinibacillus sp. NPDC098008 TaxID=3364146 RepID=UPI003816B27C